MPRFDKLTNDQLEHRFFPHDANLNQAEAMHTVRNAIHLAASTLRDVAPVSPELSRAYNKLEEASFLGVAAIARNPTVKSDAQALDDLQANDDACNLR